jgi:tetratricopeptide (TPR) repeat protein
LLALCGECRFELGEERLARPHLRALVELRPDDAIANFRLGICLLRTAADGETVGKQVARALDAAATFQRASALAPGDVDAALAVGRAYARAAEFDAGDGRDQALAQAATAFATAAAKFADSAEACFCQGVALQGRGQVDAAALAFAEALRRDPDHLGALLDLAALRAAEPAAAKSLLRRALALGDRGPQRLSDAERARIETFLRDEGLGR